MDVVPVPRAAERDAPFYSKSALAEVVQEWGTHSKIVALGEMKTPAPRRAQRISVLLLWLGG